MTEPPRHFVRCYSHPAALRVQGHVTTRVDPQPIFAIISPWLCCLYTPHALHKAHGKFNPKDLLLLLLKLLSRSKPHFQLLLCLAILTLRLRSEVQDRTLSSRD